MVHKLIAWATTSRAVVILLVLALLGGGLYSFFHVNVEAYPDPAPAIVEVVAQYPSASAEEVERLVTIPLEAALGRHAGPDLHAQPVALSIGAPAVPVRLWRGLRPGEARGDESPGNGPIAGGRNAALSPETPTGEIYRYTLSNPKDSSGRPIYTLNDLKALEDWSLERVFRRVPRIGDVSSFGGTVKRYEIHPDPDLLKRLWHHTRAIAERHRRQQRQRRRRLHSPRGRRASGPRASA